MVLFASVVTGVFAPQFLLRRPQVCSVGMCQWTGSGTGLHCRRWAFSCLILAFGCLVPLDLPLNLLFGVESKPLAVWDTRPHSTPWALLSAVPVPMCPGLCCSVGTIHSSSSPGPEARPLGSLLASLPRCPRVLGVCGRGGSVWCPTGSRASPAGIHVPLREGLELFKSQLHAQAGPVHTLSQC